MKKTYPLVLVAALLVFSLTTTIQSCKKEDISDPETIKIGVLLGFTGVGSQNATETQAALNIGLSDIKDYISRNDLQMEVELICEDTQSDTSIAKVKAQKLIDEGVKLIIGPYTSSETMAVKAIADANDVLLVSHSAVSTSLAIPNDHLMRFVPSDTYQAEALSAMLKSDSIEAIVALVRNDLWSNSLMAATDAAFSADGGTVTLQIPFEPGTVDFSAVAADVQTALTIASSTYGIGKTALYFITYADGTDLLEELSNSGVSSQYRFYGASAYAQNATLINNPTAAMMAKNTGMTCPVFGFDESASNIYGPIQSKIVTAIGNPASIYALAAYDILWVTFLTSVTQNPEVEFNTFKSHFVQTANSYYGATGRTELDINGDRKHVFYDFWAIGEPQPNTFEWEITAKYSTTTKSIQKL